MKCYKLTTQKNKTRPGCWNETSWGPEVTHETSGKGVLCGNGWLHAYASPELALLMNPVHANIENPKLWLTEAGGRTKIEPLKIGATQMETLWELEYTPPIREQYIIFGILCAKSVAHLWDSKGWCEWADGWLSGANRNVFSYATYVSYAAYADRAVVEAVVEAACAATPVRDARAARAASYAASYAAYSSDAAYAALVVAYADSTVDFVALAKQAMEIS